MDNKQNLSLEIFSANGIKVLSDKLNTQDGSNIFTEDISTLDRGIYYISISNSNNRIYTSSFIKE